MRAPVQKLVFIYNANSGKMNAFLDSVRKVVDPYNIDCRLCSLTYGLISEKKEWKTFCDSSGVPMSFLHRDEFESSYRSKFGYKFTFPVVLAESANGLELLIKTEELNALENISQLIALVQERVN
ncbi:GTPase [Ascidiimonas aurantiaca]|uniref:GTPase n=1 Tax=Ascidiimonas aurantiaca TaxID=1685432 RepID=UPI0030EEF972